MATAKTSCLKDGLEPFLPKLEEVLLGTCFIQTGVKFLSIVKKKKKLWAHTLKEYLY